MLQFGCCRKSNPIGCFSDDVMITSLQLEKEDRSQADVPEPPKEITLNNCLDLFTEKERLG